MPQLFEAQPRIKVESGGKAKPFRTGCGKAANALFFLTIPGFCCLNRWPQETAKDALDTDLIGGQSER